MAMIDCYDTLGLEPGATTEEVKKAYKRMSLLYHPDKVAAQSGGAISSREKETATEKFNEIKDAHDVLQDEDRRKIYDTFGFDLGEERLEMEVWTMGMNILLSPIFACAVRTFIARVVIWILAFRIVASLIFFLGVVYAGLFAVDFSYKEQNMRHPDLLTLHISVGVLVFVVALSWLWTPLADSVVIFYLTTEVVGQEYLLAAWPVKLFGQYLQGTGTGTMVAQNLLAWSPVGSACLFIAWLVQGWWFTIILLQVGITVVALIALTISAGIMRLWLDHMHDKHADKVCKWRQGLRRERSTLTAELSALKGQG